MHVLKGFWGGSGAACAFLVIQHNKTDNPMMSWVTNRFCCVPEKPPPHPGDIRLSGVVRPVHLMAKCNFTVIATSRTGRDIKIEPFFFFSSSSSLTQMLDAVFFWIYSEHSFFFSSRSEIQTQLLWVSFPSPKQLLGVENRGLRLHSGSFSVCTWRRSEQPDRDW